MYLVFALLAPIAMFGLLPGLAWFEERMLGPATSRKPDATPDSTPDAAADTADTAETTTAAAPTARPSRVVPAAAPLRPSPIPLQPGQSTLALPVTPLTALPDPAPRHPGHRAVRHTTGRASQHHRQRHTLKRRRGLRAA
ncbi:hypothetical protein [Yinghuangia sp. YIM S10712]|uniref:hypothetical protein n=1 Tax=Yinghuangia sp. YIM S10712 TaxID=3436930 RepID=UPI003F53A22F